MSDLVERPSFDDIHRQLEEFAERAGDDILHWKSRALKAEAKAERLEAALRCVIASGFTRKLCEREVRAALAKETGDET